ncbi:MAG: beta-galactosidase, partial [Chloroflexota bacterium]
IPRIAALGACAASALTLPIAAEVRVKRAARPLTDQWRHMPIVPQRSTLLGISFRPPQVDALGLDAHATLDTLLAFPFQLIRLGAYWNRVEPEPGRFCPEEIDWQIDAAERVGKQIILCVGAVKTFGYPEYFVPAHHLRQPLREGKLVQPAAHRPLLTAATAFVTRIVERYRDRKAIVAWQVEHEAVDPLGMEHSWRLAAGFARREVAAVRAADPTRPIMMNGFLPTSLPVRLWQYRCTRDQGDSLTVARHLADIVGIDYYPRYALLSIGAVTAYLDGGGSPWQRMSQARLRAWAHASGRPLMIAEGQAEPWETVTTPPSPRDRGMYSCLPEQVIENYNQCMRWAAPLYAYLFWGAEYWVLRLRQGDPRYLRAFARVIEHG